MTTRSTAGQPDTSLTRDLIHAALYYLRRPRALLILATVAIVAGLVFNWSWLVAAGLAPILLGTLPCLVMCAFGVCMMCRSAKEHSAPIRDVAGPATPPIPVVRDAAELTAPPALLAAAVPDDTSSGVASCCHTPASEARSPQAVDRRPYQERNPSNA